MEIEKLIEAAKLEFKELSDLEKRQFALGYDNRGIECISQRWYGPERLAGGAIWELGRLVLTVDDLLRDACVDYYG